MFGRSASQKSGELNIQNEFEGACTSFLSCFFDNKTVSSNHQELMKKKRESAERRLSATSNDSEIGSDQELLDDLELVLEGRGLISTIFLPSKVSAEGSSSSVPRTAFIRCKKGDSKVECQVVIDNTVVSNGTLKRFKFSAFDVSKVSKGRDKNSLIPAIVDDNLVMRFTIVKKGELHFVFESQHVRDDIVQGFKLFIAKKKDTINHPKMKAHREDSKDDNAQESSKTHLTSSPHSSLPATPTDRNTSPSFFPYDSSNRLLNQPVGAQ